MNRLTLEQIMAIPHTVLANGWIILTETGHCWKWNALRHYWENWK